MNLVEAVVTAIFVPGYCNQRRPRGLMPTTTFIAGIPDLSQSMELLSIGSADGAAANTSQPELSLTAILRASDQAIRRPGTA